MTIQIDIGEKTLAEVVKLLKLMKKVRLITY